MSVLDRLRRLNACGFAGLDLPRYLLDEVLERFGIISGLRRYRLRNGATVLLRGGTTDSKVFREVFAERIYAGFAEAIPAGARPRVLVDLGANVGLSSLFFEKALGFDQVIAVEPDADNVDMLRANLSGNVAADVTVHHAFAGAKRGFARIVDAGFGAWGLRMGDAAADGTPVLPLEDIVPDVPGGVLLKCDIEGGEREVFPQIHRWEDRVCYIILELHTEFFTFEQLHSVLASSRYAWQVRGLEGGRVEPGAVLAVFALERGALRGENPELLKTGASAN